jgi:FkbM family methyltransferase
MKTLLQKYLPGFISRPLIASGRFVKRQCRSIIRFLKYRSRPFFKEIHTLGLSFWILLQPTKNGCVDELIIKNGSWETGLDAMIKKYLKKEGTFVDIGANIGYHSLFVASYLSSTGKVLSFEPIQSLGDQFKKSIAKNNFTNVTVFDVALGDHEATVAMHLRKENMGESSIGAYEGLGLNDSSSTQMVEVKTLDGVLGQTSVDVIKIDVEGYELEALKGAVNILTNSHPVIFMEFSPMFYEFDRPGKSDELREYLESLGYSFYDMDNTPLDLKAWIKENATWQMAQIDIICRMA